ncbi:uncharacterized protein [Henckelia pumila]
MKSVFRGALCTKLTFYLRSLNPIPRSQPRLLLPRYVVVVPAQPSSHVRSMSGGGSGMNVPPSWDVRALENQFEELRHQLEDTGDSRERIRNISREIESTTRLMHYSLLLIHQSQPVPDVLEKAKEQINVLKNLYSRLAEIMQEYPGQYYRYHGDWRSETQTAVSLLAFMHWLETGHLLHHTEVEEKLGLKLLEFGLDIEDYLIGICFMSNELPRYVVNQVTAGDYDSPRRVLKFLTDLHASFRMLNFRNDFLRKKFDGMKYDLKRVEEVYYDVKIRGLASNGDSAEDHRQS